MNESSITTAVNHKPSGQPRILLVFAHPAAHISRVNRALLDAARDLPGVTVHELYVHYPSFFIDVRREQKLLLGHDIIVLQHPLYWYSTPALLKEWLDQVLEYGWAYGRGKARLSGKLWAHALTTGGPEDAYAPQGSNLYSIDELIRPLERTAAICGVHWEPPFVAYGGRAMPVDALRTETERYREWLNGLVDRELHHREAHGK